MLTPGTLQGASPAVLAASGGHYALAALLERAAAEQARASRRRSRSNVGHRLVWAFWRLFSRDWGALVAPWVWSVNAAFAAYVYATRLPPWGMHADAVHMDTKTHTALCALYAAAWVAWVACALARPPAAPSAIARAAYERAVATLAAGTADIHLELWLSHAHRAALCPREAVASGALVRRYDHTCPFVANVPIGLHNQREFLIYVVCLTLACAVYACVCMAHRRAGVDDALLDAALLDMGLGTLAVGQLALWQARLAARNVTAHELKAVNTRGWEKRLYYMRQSNAFVNWCVLVR